MPFQIRPQLARTPAGVLGAQGQHPFPNRFRTLLRMPMRRRRAVGEAVLARLAKAIQPFINRLSGDSKAASQFGDRLALFIVEQELFSLIHSVAHLPGHPPV